MRNSGNAALPRAEQFAAAAKPQIFFRDDEAVLGAAHDFQPFPRGLRQRLLVDEDAGGTGGPASDPAAQLMQLRQTEALGMLDDHDGGVGDIDPDLDHRGRDQHGDLAGGERVHHTVLLFGRQFAVDQADLVAEPRLQFHKALLGGGDIEDFRFRDERADPIDLRAALDRTAGPLDHLVEPLSRYDPRRDRLPSRWLLVEPRDVHIAVAREQQRAGDRCRRHHQEFRAFAGALRLQCEALMHAETMLFVDHGKRQIAELDRLLEQSMGADQNVDLAQLQPLQ